MLTNEENRILQQLAKPKYTLEEACKLVDFCAKNNICLFHLSMDEKSEIIKRAIEFYDWGDCELPTRPPEGGLCTICTNGNENNIPACKLGKAIEKDLLKYMDKTNEP